MSRRFTPFAAIAAAVMASQSGPLVPPGAASSGRRRRHRGGDAPSEPKVTEPSDSEGAEAGGAR
jgi:hypothetical protein